MCQLFVAEVFSSIAPKLGSFRQQARLPEKVPKAFYHSERILVKVFEDISAYDTNTKLVVWCDTGRHFLCSAVILRITSAKMQKASFATLRTTPQFFFWDQIHWLVFLFIFPTA